MKIAVVTGASYGLGLSITNLLLLNDFKVYGISRSEPPVKNNNFVWIKEDLLNDNGFKNIINNIKEDKIDLLVNNVGTAILESALEMTDKNFDLTFKLNFKVPIKLTNLLKDKLENCLIVNISSNSDRFAQKDYGLYSASKAALNIYFDTIAVENKDIKVFNLLPSYIDTPLQHKLNDDGKDKEFSWNITMNPDSVAKSVLKLFEDKDNYPTSAKIMIVSNKLIDDTEDPEKLWYYNVDTEEFEKLK